MELAFSWVQEKKMDEVAREPLVRRRGGRGCCGSRPNDDGRRPSEDGRRPSEGTPPSLPSQAAADGPIMIDGHDYAEMLDEMEEEDLLSCAEEEHCAVPARPEEGDYVSVLRSALKAHFRQRVAQ